MHYSTREREKTRQNHEVPMTPDIYPKRLLAVGAHPDDIDFGLGGTVNSLAVSGTEVAYCVITDGDAGGFDPTVPRETIPQIRRTEQRAAADILGVARIHFLGYPDGRLTITQDLRRDISRIIRKETPDVVVIQSPIRNINEMYASHPDHIAAGEAAMNAIYPDSRNPFAHPALLDEEGLEAWTVPQTWVTGYPEPNHWMDITSTFERKIEALRAHVSQTAHMADLKERMRNRAESVAASGGLAAGRAAEAFRVIDTR